MGRERSGKGKNGPTTGGKAPRQAGGDDGGTLVPWFVPSLAATLTHHEKVKGSPLTEAEVLRIRDEAPSILVSPEMLRELVVQRGYDDIDPDDCWRQWQALRATLANPKA
jgi:hypothetical protein